MVGHLGSFHISAAENNVTKSVSLQIPVQDPTFNWKLLGHMVLLFSFEGYQTASHSSSNIYIFTSSEQRIVSLHPYQHLFSVFKFYFMVVIVMGVSGILL